MAETFCALLTAYLLGTFVLPGRMSQRTRPVWPLALHAAMVTATSYLLLGTFHWRILLAVLLMPVVMAGVRALWRSDSITAFLVDQSLRLVVLLGLAFCFPDTAKHGWWISALRPDLSRWYFASLSCASGIVLCVPAGGVLIAKLIGPFADEIRDNDIGGLTKGGQYIGWLERILVMLLVLMGQPNGIGFLIAAKSILRFGEIKDGSQRRVAEYIIIGTFLSFGWALLISVMTLKTVGHWIP
jgi:hypothetical protein